MAIRNDFTAGEVLAAADLNDTFASKLNTTLTTKGDLISRSSSAPARLAVGTNGQVLTANSSTATGLAWGSAGGLAHIATESFSAVSSVSLNGVFTSAYANYRLLITADMASSAYLTLRWRVGGTDNSGSSYGRQQITARSATVSASSGTDNVAFLTHTSASGISTIVADIFNPQATANTVMIYHSNNTNPEIAYGRNYFTATTSFDGFTLLPETGNMTGTLRVYGYQNS